MKTRSRMTLRSQRREWLAGQGRRQAPERNSLARPRVKESYFEPGRRNQRRHGAVPGRAEMSGRATLRSAAAATAAKCVQQRPCTVLGCPLRWQSRGRAWTGPPWGNAVGQITFCQRTLQGFCGPRNAAWLKFRENCASDFGPAWDDLAPSRVSIAHGPSLSIGSLAPVFGSDLDPGRGLAGAQGNLHNLLRRIPAHRPSKEGGGDPCDLG